MYVHQQDWSAAGRIAQAHDPDSLNDVLIGQARLAFAEKAYNQAEALLLRAQRPDMAVRAYREAGLWEEAMRVAREYLPSRVQALKEEYEEEKLHGKVDHLDEPRFSTDTDDRYGRRLQPGNETFLLMIPVTLMTCLIKPDI
ncbi:unnamed protein product [Protopolystoma xenopodis]|uniref:Coatomer WD associated region domain-containing protein n=1 Tax=Protopolystoma xenopodis TaxID=117903 RepID=A0A3S5C3Q7_9PLAT|nr:unnamed protein product [Protopolystoma xenopodis]